MKRILALLLSVVVLLPAGCAFAQEATVQPAVLSAVGRCAAQNATQTVLSFELTAFGQTVAEAQSLMENSLTLLQDALFQQGLEQKDILNTRYDVDARYDYHYTKLTDRQILTGYTVVVELQLHMENERSAGAIIDAVNAAGVDCTCDLKFAEVSSSDARDAALASAAQEAMRKAGLMAEASGLKLDKLVSIEETSAQDASEVRVTYTVK